jgi:hypothetical protein
LEIISDGKSKIIIKTKDGNAPNSVIVKGSDQPNLFNKLGYEFTNIKDKDGSSSNSKEEIIVDFESNGLVNPDELEGKEAFLLIASQTLETAKTNFKTLKEEPNKKAYENAEKNFKELEKELKEYKKDKKDTIKVTAFLTENKSKTRKVKTFTITSQGLT